MTKASGRAFRGGAANFAARPGAFRLDREAARAGVTTFLRAGVTAFLTGFFITLSSHKRRLLKRIIPMKNRGMAPSNRKCGSAGAFGHVL
jgi:hypothetical protein